MAVGLIYRDHLAQVPPQSEDTVYDHLIARCLAHGWIHRRLWRSAERDYRHKVKAGIIDVLWVSADDPLIAPLSTWWCAECPGRPVPCDPPIHGRDGAMYWPVVPLGDYIDRDVLGDEGMGFARVAFARYCWNRYDLVTDGKFAMTGDSASMGIVTR